MCRARVRAGERGPLDGHMNLQDTFALTFVASIVSAIAMKLLLRRAGGDVNWIFWNESWGRELKDFGGLCDDEPYPGRILLRTIQLTVIAGPAMLIVQVLISLFRLIVR